MTEISPNLFVGTDVDYELHVRPHPGWRTVHACKEPYHRQLLGYTERAAPKSHPEYLHARRGNRLYLNLVDTHDPAYVPREIIDTAMTFIEEGVELEEKILVHCNQGESRSPSIALIHLARMGLISKASLLEAETDFRKIYPRYNPKAGIRGFLLANWEHYSNPRRKTP